ncbi:hypothetical protein INR49_018229, partial [Caranx melampygus]
VAPTPLLVTLYVRDSCVQLALSSRNKQKQAAVSLSGLSGSSPDAEQRPQAETQPRSESHSARCHISAQKKTTVAGGSEMQSGSDPSGSGLKSVRRSPRLSPQGSNSNRKEEKKRGNSLQEVKRRGKMERSREGMEEELNSRLQTLDLSGRSAATGTGLVYSETFTHPKNLWEPSHVESPNRVTSIMEELEKQDLLSHCIKVEEMFQVCLLAVGSVLQLVDQVMTSELRNGFAVIRVLIVDWDVHHGQGIQYLFQEDPSVLYFSIHRYEKGSFWPHLPESDSQFVGSGRAEGRNINLPWNQASPLVQKSSVSCYNDNA